MTNFSFQSYEPDEVPEAPGVYCFRVRVISRSELGLLGAKRPLPIAETGRLRERILKKLVKVFDVLSSGELHGHLGEEKDRKLAFAYQLTANSAVSMDKDYLRASLAAIDDVYELVLFMERLTALTPPLYVGMSVAQTLKQRYNQHWSNYNSSVSGTFGCRIRESGLEWEELQYSAIEAPAALPKKQSIELCEWLALSLAKPKLSNK